MQLVAVVQASAMAVADPGVSLHSAACQPPGNSLHIMQMMRCPWHTRTIAQPKQKGSGGPAGALLAKRERLAAHHQQLVPGGQVLGILGLAVSRARPLHGPHLRPALHLQRGRTLLRLLQGLRQHKYNLSELHVRLDWPGCRRHAVPRAGKDRILVGLSGAQQHAPAALQMPVWDAAAMMRQPCCLPPTLLPTQAGMLPPSAILSLAARVHPHMQPSTVGRLCILLPQALHPCPQSGAPVVPALQGDQAGAWWSSALSTSSSIQKLTFCRDSALTAAVTASCRALSRS